MAHADALHPNPSLFFFSFFKCPQHAHTHTHTHTHTPLLLSESICQYMLVKTLTFFSFQKLISVESVNSCYSNLIEKWYHIAKMLTHIQLQRNSGKRKKKKITYLQTQAIKQCKHRDTANFIHTDPLIRPHKQRHTQTQTQKHHTSFPSHSVSHTALKET